MPVEHDSGDRQGPGEPKKPMNKALITAVVALAASAPLTTAAAEDTAPGFADMLRLIPASERTWQAWRTFSYVDFRAVEAAAGLPHAQSEIRLGDGATEVFNDWPAERRAAWRSNLRRVGAGPPLLSAYAGRIGTLDAAMADVVGVDFFAIDRALVFWETPGADGVQVLAGDPPITDLQTMRDWNLSSRGFLSGIATRTTSWRPR